MKSLVPGETPGQADNTAGTPLRVHDPGEEAVIQERQGPVADSFLRDYKSYIQDVTSEMGQVA